LNKGIYGYRRGCCKGCAGLKQTDCHRPVAAVKFTIAEKWVNLPKRDSMELASLDRNKTYTPTDYLSWDFPERVELINGKVYEVMAAPSPYHQKISGNIFMSFALFLKDEPYDVYYAPIDVYLPGNSKDDTVLQPAICVICDRSKIQKKGCIGAPDIVVEVLSPGNTTKEMKLKYQVYEDAGVLEYWVVSPLYQLL